MATRTIWRDCAHCFHPFEQPNDPGRKRVFCSDACKQAAYRLRKRRAEQAEQQRQRRFYEQAREHARRQHEHQERAHRERASTEPPGDTGRPRFHCAGCGGRRAAHTFHHDQPAHSRAHRRWDALLRKAASTTFPEEAAACRAKAEEIAAKYGL